MDFGKFISQSPLRYFILFSNVAEDKGVKYTLSMPYSEAKI